MSQPEMTEAESPHAEMPGAGATADPRYHHAVIARAIETIAARLAESLSLAEVAAGVGLSPAHFQRVFSQ